MVRKSLEGNLTKKAYSKSKYDDQRINDLKKCADKKDGYLYFMENFMWIQHPIKGRMKFEPYDFQRGLLDTYNSNRFAISMCARQTGKTTVQGNIMVCDVHFDVNIAAHKYLVHRILCNV